MPDSTTAENGTADHALFANQLIWAREGYAAISGCEATAGSGDWEVDITAGEVLVDGTPFSVDAQSITLTAPTDNPRWDVLWVDGTADSGSNVTALEGSEQPPDELDDGTRLTRLETRYPVPDDSTDQPRTVLGIVWVDPELGPSLSDADVIDRRISATAVADAVDTQSATVADAPTSSTDVLRKTELDSHTATDNPHGTDLEDARSEDNTLGGDVDAGGNDLLNLGKATATEDPLSEDDLTTKGYVDSVVQGLDWQESALDRQNDPPASPAEGDRYLVDSTPTGAWDTHADEIAEWDGSAWVFSPPDEGFSIFVEDADVLLVYQAENWISFGSAIDHGALAGLGDDDHTQYFHTDGRRQADRVDIDGPNSEAVDTQTVSGSTTLDVSSNNAFRHTLSGDVDYTLSGGGTVLPGEAISLLIEQDGSTQHPINWPSVNWDIDQEQPDDPQPGNLLEVVLRTYDGGATWYGSIAGRF